MKETEATKTEAKINYAALKAGGIIEQRQRDYFVLRLRIPCGRISAEQFPKVAEVAKKYGRGIVHLTTRQGIEIPWIEFKNIENARRELAEAGITLGACGPRFRVVTACPGNEVCKRGLVDTQKFGREIDQRFFGLILPHKFKVSVSGCPNICAKPHENDIGFHGIVEPELDLSDCIGCGTCAEVCKEEAIAMKDGKPKFDLNKCIYCGDCILNCPTDSWRAKRTGYAVFAGGKMGRHPQLGYKIAEFVDEERGFEIIQRCLEIYKREGRRKERFGAMINRIGLERFKEEVIGG
jgi:dissimilatory sulfite reductase (desulfoviridin) alpha/beta subunit